MTGTKTYTVLDGGLTCREQNPHEQYGDLLMETTNWKEFEATVQTYPLTKWCEPGSLVMGEDVWQHSIWDSSLLQYRKRR